MLEMFDVNYESLKEQKKDELFHLRKKTFKERLNWQVQCKNDMEFDEYDNTDTNYMIGVFQSNIICSVRFIKLENPNMITHTFQSYFRGVKFKNGNYLESSRFFVHKERAQELLGCHYPISTILLLSMINYCQHYGFDGIYTIVSKAMLSILRRAGWKFENIKEGYLSEKERIYLLFLPVTLENQTELATKIRAALPFKNVDLCTWPLLLPQGSRAFNQT